MKDKQGQQGGRQSGTGTKDRPQQPGRTPQNPGRQGENRDRTNPGGGNPQGQNPKREDDDQQYRPGRRDNEPMEPDQEPEA